MSGMTKRTTKFLSASVAALALTFGMVAEPVQAQDTNQKTDAAYVTTGRPVQIESWADYEREVLNSALPVLVEFDADWCGVCKRTEPILEQLAAKRADSLKVAFIDYDRNPDLVEAFGVQAVPSLFVIHRGAVLGTRQGLDAGVRDKDISDWVDWRLSRHNVPRL